MPATSSAQTDLSLPIEAEVPADLLALALTHRSYANEKGGLPNNERLEFLGDAVLEMVVTDTLYRRYPERSEGELAKIRASVVNARACADAARELGLGAHLLLGRGETTTGGSEKTSILADALEAVLGAVYVGCGMDASAELIHVIFGRRMAESAELGVGLDWKTSLQELSARLGLGVPEYVSSAHGPDHRREFTSTIKLQSSFFGHGSGRTKKDAEMQAAEAAYREILSQQGAAGA